MNRFQAIGPDGPRVSSTQVSILVAAVVNLAILALKHFGIVVPPDGIEALNVLLGAAILHYMRRGIDSARATPQPAAEAQIVSPPEG